MAAPRSRVLRALDLIERVGNRLPDPITLFALFAGIVLVASWVAAMAGVSATHPGTGAMVESVNLLSGEGLRRILTGAVRNFTSFPPLGLVIVVIIGIGVTERSGLITVALTRLVHAVPPFMLTATLVFGGVMSSMAGDAGYVVLTPLGAMIFAAVGRHPLAGLAAAFAGVAGGFSANLLVTALDPLVAGISTTAAQLVDPAYEVLPTANYYFMVASVFLVTTVGTIVSSKIVEPRLGTWNPVNALELIDTTLHAVTPAERRGLRAAGITCFFFLLVVALLVVPPHGLLRNPEAAGRPLMEQIRPFLNSIVSLLMVLFLICGTVYGVVAGTIKSDRDVARMSGEGVSVLGSYIVLAFAAAQFTAWFNWSNLGLILAIKGADGFRALQFSGVPLLLGVILVAACVNLLIGSASAKWAVIAPVFVPMLMLLGYSPEAVQAAYRVGDSSTNMITPLTQYFPVILAFAMKYDRRAGIGTLISSMLPFSIAFLLSWGLMFAAWILLGLPLGPGAPLHYVPGVGVGQ